MIKIPLANAEGRYALIDDEDLHLVEKTAWGLHSNGYAIGRIKDPTTKRSRLVLMHRLVLGTRPGKVTHHRDGDKLDNRKCNLIELTNMTHSRFHSCKRIPGYVKKKLAPLHLAGQGAE